MNEVELQISSAGRAYTGTVTDFNNGVRSQDMQKMSEELVIMKSLL
jgi:hypothetical protein